MIRCSLLTKITWVIFCGLLGIAPVWGMPLQRIGVLDFSNLTGSKENDWVCEAFTASLSTKLSRVVEMSVMDRQSLSDLDGVSRLSGEKIKDEDAKELARLAGLDFLVFGSVQSSGEIHKKNAPLRVHARLVDTVRGVVHQAVIVDGFMENIFDLQFRLAKEFVDLSRIEISLSELNSMRSESTLNLEAYRLYNLGMLAKGQKKYSEAIKYFEQAMAKHPGILYADAHYQIGQVYLALGKKEELLLRFRSDVAKLAPVYYDLGLAYRENGDFEKAIGAFQTFVQSTDQSPSLWELQIQDENFQLYCDKETHRAVFIQGDRLNGLDTSTGQVLWQKTEQLPKGVDCKMINRSLLVQNGKNIQRINIDTGEVIGAINDHLTAIPDMESSSDEIVIAMTETRLEVKNQKETLWSYQTKPTEKIVGRDNNAFFVQNGRHRLKALRIQRGRIPGTLDGLLQLTECLTAQNRGEESMEVCRYILDHIDDQNPEALQGLLRKRE